MDKFLTTSNAVILNIIKNTLFKATADNPWCPFKDTMKNIIDQSGLADSEWSIYEKACSIGDIQCLKSGVVFGVVFSKKCSQIGKKPPQNRPHCFGAVPTIIIVSDVSELSPKPCHPPFTPATPAIECKKQKVLKIAAFLTKPTPKPDTKKGQPGGWPS